MNKKTLKGFFEKNSRSLIAPAVMIVLGLFFILFPENAISLTVKVVGVIFVLIAAILGCTLIAAVVPGTVVIAAILLIFGIICIALSTFVASFIIKIIGLIIIFNSIMRIYDAYKIKGSSDHFVQYIINDVATLILGIVLLLIPMNIAGAVVIILGAFLFIIGISNVITCVRVYRDGCFVDDGSEVVWEE